ncbi:MAG: M43 family zinc metalloprotease [Chitinophagaceae bacterium]
MKKRLVGFFLFLSLITRAQTDCRQQDYQHQLLQLNPQTSSQYQQIENFISKHKQTLRVDGNVDSSSSSPLVQAAPIKIVVPVVVHVLWNNNAQNITDAQVLSQLDVLNKDYSGTNTDRKKVPAYFSALAADCGISFALAKTDPKGKPTNGIVRTQTSIISFSYDDKMKASATGGDDAWDANSYLNIWVCNLTNGITGYSSVPGGPTAKDGVVITTNAFGTINKTGIYNLGRTATHEIGHWLNLRHIWGDASCGDDLVDDTPSQQGPNRGCNSGEKFSCGTTAHGDMYMNFMDFSDDACMYMFTNGQGKRMRLLFEVGGPRNSILYSAGLTGTGLPLDTAIAGSDVSMEVLLYPNPAVQTITMQVNKDNGASGKTIMLYNQMGQMLRTFRLISKQQPIDISELKPGIYFIKMEGAGKNAMMKFVKQ